MAHTFYDNSRGRTFTTPSPMGESGRYLFEYKPTLRINGAGNAVQSAYSQAVWTWNYMRYDDYIWWVETLLQHARTKVFVTGTTIENDRRALDVVSLVVHRPTFDYVSGGYYYNVKVEYKNILQ